MNLLSAMHIQIIYVTSPTSLQSWNIICIDNYNFLKCFHTGVLFELHADSFDWTTCEQDIDIPMLFHISPSSELVLPSNCISGHIYLCAKHGKSRHTAVWSLENVKNSNANLFELDPSKETLANNYVVPEEGISVGLRGKIVVICYKKSP